MTRIGNPSKPRQSKNQVFIGDDGFIHHVYQGDQNGPSIEKMGIDSDPLIEDRLDHNESILVIVDARGLGQADTAAQRQAKRFLATRHFHKVAIFGLPAHLRIVARLVTQVSGRGDKVRFFNDEAAAAQWLSEV